MRRRVSVSRRAAALQPVVQPVAAPRRRAASAQRRGKGWITGPPARAAAKVFASNCTRRIGGIRRDARRHALMTSGCDQRGSGSGEASSRRLGETRPLRAVGRTCAVRGEAGLRHRRRQFHAAQRRHVLRIGPRERQRGDMADAAVGIGQVQLGLVRRRIGLLRLLAVAGLVPVFMVAEMRLGRHLNLMPAIRGGSRPGELERQDERKEDKEEALHQSWDLAAA
ncbi:hypothetical protein CBM2587_B90563 [Cupriavidus taiwanensis]|uniref:Uncharacterized protein n=1 Tax=Cupriavidus taiwanensis TaxID=164546 RepID=A0A975XFH2_9BURK|nr:hypothetical protein CBM2587_B90563 [Cupriavidus taiwanensis]